MRRQDLEAAFDGRLSSRCIKRRDGNYVVVGKWCIIEKVGELWDVWICNPGDMTAGLGQRKVHNIVRGFTGDLHGGFTVLNGEAYARVADPAVVFDNMPLLGLFYRKRVFPKVEAA